MKESPFGSFGPETRLTTVGGGNSSLTGAPELVYDPASDTLYVFFVSGNRIYKLTANSTDDPATINMPFTADTGTIIKAVDLVEGSRQGEGGGQRDALPSDFVYVNKQPVKLNVVEPGGTIGEGGGQAMQYPLQPPHTPQISFRTHPTLGFGFVIGPIDSEVGSPVPSSWKAGLNLSSIRIAPGRSQLPNGKWVITGGDTAPATQTASVDIVSADGSAITAGPAMSVGRSYHPQVTLPDGRVVVVAAGTPASVNGSKPETLDANQTAWTLGDTVPTVTGTMTLTNAGFCVLADGRVMVLGGMDNVTGLVVSGLHHAFDPSAAPGSQWTSVGAPPQALIGQSLVTLRDGRVLRVGGTTTSPVVPGAPATASLNASLWNPNTVSWTDIPNPVPGVGLGFLLSAILLKNGSVLVFGGFTDGWFNGQAAVNRATYVYTPDAGVGTWRRVGDLPQMAVEERNAVSAVLLDDGRVFVAGTEDDGEYIGGPLVGLPNPFRTMVFSPDTLTWLLGPTLPINPLNDPPVDLIGESVLLKLTGGKFMMAGGDPSNLYTGTNRTMVVRLDPYVATQYAAYRMTGGAEVPLPPPLLIGTAPIDYCYFVPIAQRVDGGQYVAEALTPYGRRSGIYSDPIVDRFNAPLTEPTGLKIRVGQAGDGGDSITQGDGGGQREVLNSDFVYVNRTPVKLSLQDPNTNNLGDGGGQSGSVTQNTKTVNL